MGSILVVEDEYDSVTMLSKILSHHGIEVYHARNGQECLELLAHVAPALIITDLAMPGMDGWQTLAAVRADPHTAHIPVVAVTAYHSVDVAHDARAAGFDGFFAKPVDPRLFVEQLRAIAARV